MSTLRLNQDDLTFEQARSKDFDVVHQHYQASCVDRLYHDLWTHRESIASIATRQLRLVLGASCTVAPTQQWIRGSFNVCIPIDVESSSFCKKLMMRCPMPFKLAEPFYPGTVDEKLRCEVGTYVWMEANCPNIRIPRLYGFGIANRHYTHEDHLPWYARIYRAAVRFFRSLIQPDTFSRYAPITMLTELPTQYMLLEYVGPDTGQMLSNTWNAHRDDPDRRRQLFKGISQIIISLSRVPQTKIGSFCFNNNGSVTLTGRPLFSTTMMLEEGGAERCIPAGQTYSCTEPFLSDFITLHDNFFLGNPSAADDEGDCRSHMAIRIMLRALSHHFVNRDYRNGPFMVQLTDLHQSNIFVDDDWSITCLLDLEWICALPPEACCVPLWLTGEEATDLVDDQDGQKLTKYNAVWKEFTQVLVEEEAKAELDWPLTKIMDDMWHSSGAWFWACLHSTNAAYYLIDDHLCPRFSARLSPKIEEFLSRLWKQDGSQTIAKKVAEFQEYEQDLGRLFAT